MQIVDLRSAKNTLGDLAYGHLLNAILTHELKPGARLRPEDLAAAMGLSPTPVKHALARLAGEGLVEYRAGQGPSVVEPKVDDILELYGCRLMCELHAVREGFSRVDDPFVRDLRRGLDTHEAAVAARDDGFDSQRRILEADRDFHGCYMRLWPNAKAAAWYGQLNTHIRSFQIGNRMIGRPGMQIEHRAIYEAFAARDLDGILTAVRFHLESARDSFLERARIAAAASDAGRHGRAAR
jgi:DNA-binding GntR family transcriptional regulator